MSKQSKIVLGVGTLLLLGAVSLHGQSYTMDWYTIDGGGGASSGGGYSLTGTIGQPDAVVAAGGAYSLAGGFWPGILVVPNTEAPTLFIASGAEGVTISWLPEDSGYQLEEAVDLGSPDWTLAPEGNPVTLPATGEALFYRLRKP